MEIECCFFYCLHWKATVGVIGRLRLRRGKQKGDNSASALTVSHNVSGVCERLGVTSKLIWTSLCGRMYRWGFQDGKRERKDVLNVAHSFQILIWKLKLLHNFHPRLTWPEVRWHLLSGALMCKPPWCCSAPSNSPLWGYWDIYPLIAAITLD